MGYSLTFYYNKNGDGILTLSLVQRLITIFAFLVISGAFAYNVINHNSLWINGFFLILTILACFYREFWCFSAKDQSITFAYGIAFWLKKTKIPIDNVDSIKLITIKQRATKSKKEKIIAHQLVLTAAKKDAIMDSGKEKHFSKLEETGKKIAQILGIELEQISF